VQNVCDCSTLLYSPGDWSARQHLLFIQPRDAVIHSVHHLVDGIRNLFHVILKRRIWPCMSQLLLSVFEYPGIRRGSLRS